ncbi:bestrophin family protein [Singulisphaera rosea]
MRIAGMGAGIDDDIRFWRDAFAIHGSVTQRVSRRVFVFGLIAAVVFELNELLVHIDLGIEVAPYEVAGAALGLLLVLRTNAGYDRWWEGKKLWGGINNQSRNLIIAALAYGPDQTAWRRKLLRWTASFPYVVMHSLRAEREIPEVVKLLGEDSAAEIAKAEHMPTYVSLRIAEILREGYDGLTIDRFALLEAEKSRALLIDHLGGCERILNSPLPMAYAIDIRRFIVLFLSTLPFALLPKLGSLTPLATIMIAYPIMALDDIGSELQNPFDSHKVGHFPLDRVCSTIETQLFALLGEPAGASEDGRPAREEATPVSGAP